jgi:hypothetical protein
MHTPQRTARPHRRFFAPRAGLLLLLAACGGGATAGGGGHATSTSAPGSGLGTGGGNTGGLCSHLSKGQVEQVFGITVPSTDFQDPLAQSATDTTALCVYFAADGGVTIGYDHGTTAADAQQAYQLDSGISHCQHDVAGLGDAACVGYYDTTQSQELVARKGNYVVFISRPTPHDDPAVADQLKQAAALILQTF